MNLTEKEREALNKKLENPKAIVECPRCGKKLLYLIFDSAIVVKCEDTICISKTLRGI